MEFYFNGERKRISGKLNKLLDYTEKMEAFTKLKDSITKDLKDGTYGKPLIKPIIIPSVKDGVKEFIQWHHDKGSRLKTIQSYSSKLKFLVDALGDVSVNYVYHKDIDDLLIVLNNDNKWSTKTFNNCRLIFFGLFNYCIDRQYITTNPVQRIKTKYVAKSKRNKAFTVSDFSKIMIEVEKDAMLSMFVKGIYYCCIRPQELSKLRVSHIDFDKRIINIPSHISKNKKDGFVALDDCYYDLLKEYYYNAPSDNYLFCNDTILFGEIPYQPNRPYKRFVKILDKLGMSGRGYTLYSVKHYSNCRRYLDAQWDVASIMVQNRHCSLSETENYLRDLVDFVNVSKNKAVPAI